MADLPFFRSSSSIFGGFFFGGFFLFGFVIFFRRLISHTPQLYILTFFDPRLFFGFELL